MLILLISADRRFRAVTSSLLERHGCRVTSTTSFALAFDCIERRHPDVVVLDTGRSLTAAANAVAGLQRLAPPIGIALVAEERHRAFAGYEVLRKWDPFEDLLQAIDNAYRARTKQRPLLSRA